MLHIVRAVLATLFPLAPASAAILDETPQRFLRFYNPQRIRGAVALIPYSTPQVRSAILANKFHQDRHASALLQTVLMHWLQAQGTSRTIVVPIPLGKRRLRSRGHNQVATILEGSTLGEHCTYIPNLLLRTRETSEQSHLNRTARTHNVKNAFAWNTKHDPETYAGAKFIVIDDVITTGATLKAAHAALQSRLPRSAEIVMVGIAH